MSVASIYDVSNMGPVFIKLGNDLTTQPNSGMYLEIFKFIMNVLISTVKPITFNLFDYFLDKLCSKFIILGINLPILFIFLGRFINPPDGEESIVKYIDDFVDCSFEYITQFRITIDNNSITSPDLTSVFILLNELCYYNSIRVDPTLPPKYNPHLGLPLYTSDHLRTFITSAIFTELCIIDKFNIPSKNVIAIKIHLNGRGDMLQINTLIPYNYTLSEIKSSQYSCKKYLVSPNSLINQIKYCINLESDKIPLLKYIYNFTIHLPVAPSAGPPVAPSAGPPVAPSAGLPVAPSAGPPPAGPPVAPPILVTPATNKINIYQTPSRIDNILTILKQFGRFLDKNKLLLPRITNDSYNYCVKSNPEILSKINTNLSSLNINTRNDKFMLILGPIIESRNTYTSSQPPRVIHRRSAAPASIQPPVLPGGAISPFTLKYIKYKLKYIKLKNKIKSRE